MDRTKANRAMLKRLLLAVAVMLVFTYGLAALYDRVANEMGSANERITAMPESSRHPAHPAARAAPQQLPARPGGAE